MSILWPTRSKKTQAFSGVLWRGDHHNAGDSEFAMKGNTYEYIAKYNFVGAMQIN